MSDKKVPTEIDLSSVLVFEMPLFQALRRLQQAGEVHAKRLARFGGLTPMQLLVLDRSEFDQLVDQAIPSVARRLLVTLAERFRTEQACWEQLHARRLSLPVDGS